jgi:hypothetical protein
MATNPLHTAPWNSEKDIAEWFKALPEEERKAAVQELQKAIGHIQTLLVADGPVVADVIVPGVLSLVRRAGLWVLGAYSQAIMTGVDRSEPK